MAVPLALGLVVGLAVLTFALRGVGPFLQTVPAAVTSRTPGLAPALLAALVAIELTDSHGVLHPDARLAAVIVAAGLAALRAPLLLCVVAGAAVAALLRLLFP